MRTSDKYLTTDARRDSAKRTAARLHSDSPRAICGKTRTIGPALMCPNCGTHVANVLSGSLEVCPRPVNHDGPCFEWGEK